MVEINTSLLAHVPPAVASDKVVVKPSHTLRVPVIGAGIGYTVTVAVAKQPAADV